MTPSAPREENNETSFSNTTTKHSPQTTTTTDLEQKKSSSSHLPNLYSTETSSDDEHYSFDDNFSPSVDEYIRFAKKSRYGVLLWKVDRYAHKLAEARRLQTSLISPTFYTSKRGYKMRMEVWLNGKGMGKNTCVSLYAQIVKGSHGKLFTPVVVSDCPILLIEKMIANVTWSYPGSISCLDSRSALI